MINRFLARIRSNKASTSPEIDRNLGVDLVARRPSTSANTTGIDVAIASEQRQREEDLAGFIGDKTLAHLPPDLLNPTEKGIVMVSTRQLMEANRMLIEQGLDAFSGRHHLPDFDNLMLELVRRFAHWVGPLPASRAHHHDGRGGLFSHSIGVAVGALHMSISKNVTYNSSPRDREPDNLAWQLICFIGGLLHDIGKVHTIGIVNAYSCTAQNSGPSALFRPSSSPTYEVVWHPTVEGFASWAKRNSVESYFIDFDGAPTDNHVDFTQRYMMQLVPQPLLAYIYSSNRVIRQQFEDFIRNPMAAARTPIFQVIQDADHLNTAQSIDPRRKPGTIEMTSLVLRRFSEFAAEMPWNLPSSPFIYAHVQHQTDSGLRFFGLPFFIATETNIAHLIDYILSKPMLGVSFGERITELVFNALESSGMIYRSIDRLLPDQIPDEQLQSFIPASKALVRFRAKHTGEIIRIDGVQEDAIIGLSVISAKLSPPSGSTLSAPMLSFTGSPEGSSATALAVTIDNGTLAPSDRSLVRDEAYMAQFNEILARSEKQRPDSEGTEIIPAVQPRRKSRKVKAAPVLLTEVAREEDSGLAEDQPAVAEGNSDIAGSSQPTHAATEKAISFDGPPWLHAYNDCVLGDGDLSPHVLWSLVWLYLRDNHNPVLKVHTNGKGIYSFEGQVIPLSLRDSFGAALHECGFEIGIMSRNWPKETLTSETKVLQESFQRKENSKGKAFLQLSPEACELIDTFLELEKK